MIVKVYVSTPLMKVTGGEREISCHAGNMANLLDELKGRFPGLIDTICDSEGNIKPVVSVYLNDSDIRFLSGAATELSNGDEVHIIPTIAGG